MVKTWLGCMAVISSNVVANYALARGMHSLNVQTLAPIAYFRAMAHPWTIIGIVFMTSWFTTRLAVLSWADLSYIMPINSLSYLLTALVGALSLGEKVSPMQWSGIVIITLGVLLVALTDPETEASLETKP